MSADFRLKNPADYETYYGWTHDHPEMLKEAAYGLPELAPRRNQKSLACRLPRLHGNRNHPRLAPIVKAGLIDNNRIVADLKVGFRRR
jgi:N-acetyl-gamma-glutamylphosphate reductase